MDENRALLNIAKGGAIFFIGSFLAMILGYIARIILIRYLTVEQYGLISLANTVFSIGFTIAGLGISMGVARQAAYYLGKKDENKAKGIFKAGIFIVLISSVFATTFIFISADKIAETFHNEMLSFPVRVFILALPFALISDVIIGIFRAKGSAKEKFVFIDFLPNFLKVILFSTMVALAFPFEKIVALYILPVLISYILCIAYFKRHVDLKTNISVFEVWKPLLLFSLPIYLPGLISLAFTTSNNIIIGYYLDAAQVGIFNAAALLSGVLLQLMPAIAFLYLPIASQIYAQNDLLKLKRVFSSITKWATSIALPVFLVMALFPEEVVNFLYGSQYLVGAAVLSILSVGYFINTAFGPSGMTFVAIGKPRILTYVSAINAITNITLNILLVPKYGIIGSAYAVSITYILSKIIFGVILYKNYRIHPFTKTLVKPVVLAITIAYLLEMVISKFVVVKWWMLPIFFIVFIIIYFLSLLLTKSFDEEDIMLLKAIERKLGLDLKIVKKILKRFI